MAILVDFSPYFWYFAASFTSSQHLFQDHKPNREDETRRIEAAGGYAERWGKLED
jgi:hypothetical protein